MTAVLTYTTADGTQKQSEFMDDVFYIKLNSVRIASIDLSTLASCSSLHGLDLNVNNLQTIDLTPIATCTSLQILDLSRNQLQTIDLTPLATCASLDRLYLSGNRLQTIDLSPLATCAGLEALYLTGNRLQTIDLTPLASCSSLQQVELNENQFESIDALHSWLETPIGVYRRPTGSYPWSLVHWIAVEFGTGRRVQQDILCAIGLKDYGFIDCDLSAFFLSIPPDTPTDRAREQVRERLLDKIAQAIDQEGATTGLKLEELSKRHGEIAKIAQRIIRLRKAEMHRVQVGTQDDEFDLRELWLTAYGYEVLTALEMRFATDLEGVKRVKSALAELGLKLKTGETSKPGTRMSDELKQAILWIAQNRGRDWNEIENSGFSQ
jgi:hypothetical protein